MKYMITDVKRLENAANNVRFLLNAYLNGNGKDYDPYTLECDIKILLEEVSDILPENYLDMMPKYIKLGDVPKWMYVRRHTVFLNEVIDEAINNVLDESVESWDY